MNRVGPYLITTVVL